MTNWSELTIAAIEAALQAGKFLKDSFYKPHTVSSKEGKKNLVTECDLLAEEMILSFLQNRFPTHSFLSEERGPSGSESFDILWVIDPLDGTVNFAYQIPLFTVSIAACKEDEVLSGVIFQPMTNELFIAEKGKGAFLNDIKIHVSKEVSLSDSFLAIELPYNIHEDQNSNINPLLYFLRHGISIRRLGSAALNLAYVASGRFDAFFEKDLYPWDVAAGMLLVEEAGGTISLYNGQKKSPTKRSTLLSSNTIIHNELLQLIDRETHETH